MLFVQHPIADSELGHLGGQSGSLQSVPTCIELILKELLLIAQDLNLALDTLEGIFVPSKPLHLCQHRPIVQLGHCLPKVMEIFSGAMEHVMEPSRHDLNRVKALVVRGGIQVDDAGFLALLLPSQ